MPHVVGTDEAGYGPNLGPLVISASVWEVPEAARPDDLYRLVDRVIAPAHARKADGLPTPVVIADSKSLYHSGQGIALLERGVLAALGALGHRPGSWRGAWQVLSPGSAEALASHLWYTGYDGPVPLENEPGEIDISAQTLREGLTAAGVRLVHLRSRAVFETEFNRLVEQYGSKGAVLSQATLALAAGALTDLPYGPVSIVCDKHGGRNSYRGLLEQWFPDRLIEIYGEGRQQSIYRFGPLDRRVEIRFRAQGESCLATALASMASKYLRELAMRAVNAFWCGRVPGLAPTAGYPADARRFKQAIAAAQAELGIDDRLLWRMK